MCQSSPEGTTGWTLTEHKSKLGNFRNIGRTIPGIIAPLSRKPPLETDSVTGIRTSYSNNVHLNDVVSSSSIRKRNRPEVTFAISTPTIKLS